VEKLGKPEVVQEISYEAILLALRNDFVGRFPAIAPYIDLETEPSRINIEVDAYRETILRARINDAARAYLLPFATGVGLDTLAAFYGVIRLTSESDKALRQRVVLAIVGASPGGTAQRYESIARGASVQVAAANVWFNETTRRINVSVLPVGGGVASPALLATVNAALQASDVRLVGDTIVVSSATNQTVNIVAECWFLPDAPSNILATTRQAILNAWAKESGIGFDLTVPWITARLMQPGVQSVNVISPAQDVEIDENHAVSIGTVSITDKGRAF
jgi:phage-related baseplate assembly protein